MADQESMLSKVRALLAKAEAEGVTPQERDALNAKAAELMAKYGIEQAMLAAARPGTDHLTNKVFDIPNPWARVHAHLLGSVAQAMRCRCIFLNYSNPGQRLHVFGYASDIERAELLYTSLLLQAGRGLAAAVVPWHLPPARVRAWRRSWLLGFVNVVTGRIKAAEDRAAEQAEQAEQSGTQSAGLSTALVLADRSLAVTSAFEDAYPNTRKISITSTGTGYRDGASAGRRADIGTTRVGSRSGRELAR